MRRVVDDVARPMSADGQAALWLIDAQVLQEAAIQAVRSRDTERGIQLMRMALLYYWQAAGKVKGLKSRSGV